MCIGLVALLLQPSETTNDVSSIKISDQICGPRSSQIQSNDNTSSVSGTIGNLIFMSIPISVQNSDPTISAGSIMTETMSSAPIAGKILAEDLFISSAMPSESASALEETDGKLFILFFTVIYKIFMLFTKILL